MDIKELERPRQEIEEAAVEGNLPKLLRLLEDGGHATFYRDGQFLGLDGTYHPLPQE